MKSLKGYRTILFNVVMGGIVFINQVWGTSIDAGATIQALHGLEESLIAIWGVGNIILRTITTTPVGRKE